MAPVPRRAGPALFFAALLAAHLGAQGLGSFSGAGPAPCKTDAKATPSAPAGPEFKAKSPERASLIDAGITGTKIVLTGNVSGLTCGPIKHAMGDIWQADG